jgi:transcriptional regulator with XRE-family HTH domain
MIVNRIKELRTARKITLQQMADAVGSSVATVQRVEKGGVDLVHELVEPIAAVLGVPWYELLCEPVGTANAPGLSESAAPFAPDHGHALARMPLGATEAMFIAQSDTLDAIGIKAGDVIICDVGRDAVRNVATGDVVVAQLYGSDLTTATTVLMQFVAP